MRWLVTGAEGMLGADLVALLTQRGHRVTGAGRGELDITDEAACLRATRGHDVVANCAAYTAVDAAEDDEPAAYAVNAVGVANLAKSVAAHGGSLVQVSTDYVFPGTASSPYAVDAPVGPTLASAHSLTIMSSRKGVGSPQSSTQRVNSRRPAARIR